MKVFTPEKWDNFEKELSKIGKVISIERGKIKNRQKVIFDGKKFSVNIDAELNDVLEMLADLGYDFVAFRFDAQVPKASSVEEVLVLKDFESLKSLIRKVKKSEGTERCGAIGIFVGFVRKMSNGRETVRLEYEEDEEFFEKKIEDIENKLKSYPGVVDVKIFHKTGIILPGEDIIYVVVMGEHRENIWKPLEEGMNIIKKELPIWKKEIFVDGEVWAHDAKYMK